MTMLPLQCNFHQRWPCEAGSDKTQAKLYEPSTHLTGQTRCLMGFYWSLLLISILEQNDSRIVH